MTSAGSSLLAGSRDNTHSGTVKGHIKLEDGLNIRDLLDLKDAFMDVGGDKSEKISYEQFREACQQTLGTSHEEQVFDYY